LFFSFSFLGIKWVSCGYRKSPCFQGLDKEVYNLLMRDKGSGRAPWQPAPDTEPDRITMGFGKALLGWLLIFLIGGLFLWLTGLPF
jgi:retron-type reverse transcriptase